MKVELKKRDADLSTIFTEANPSEAKLQKRLRDDQITKFQELQRKRQKLLTKTTKCRKELTQNREKVTVEHNKLLKQEDEQPLSSKDDFWLKKGVVETTDKFKGLDHGTIGLKNGLDKEIEKAISRKDPKMAWLLNEAKIKETAASRTREIDRQMQHASTVQDEVAKRPRKRKKLHWGMEIMQRWETKGNM